MSPAGISVGGGHVLGPERAWLHDAVNLCASSWLQGSQPEEGGLPAHRFCGQAPRVPAPCFHKALLPAEVGLGSGSD